MKQCNKDGCTTMIDEKYTYCYEHYVPQKTDLKKENKQWHDDPIVDQLMKMNSNLGRINEQLTTLINAFIDAKLK